MNALFPNCILINLCSFLRKTFVYAFVFGLCFICLTTQAQITVELEDTPKMQVPQEDDIRISPNPASDYVAITPKVEIEVQKIEILDTQGAIIFTTLITASVFVVPNINSGLFYFKIYTNVGTYIKPLMVVQE